MTESAPIQIGQEDDVFIVRFSGRVTRKSLHHFREAFTTCSQQPEIRGLLVDVTACEYMDSTVLGSLARRAIEFSNSHAAQPHLVGLPQGPLERLFMRMNLTALFSVAPKSVKGPDFHRLDFSTAPVTDNRTEYARDVLDAHETLAKLSPDNARQFAPLIEMLRKECPFSAE